VMRASAVGTVVASRARDVEVGDVVAGRFGWQEVATVDASTVERTLDDRFEPRSLALGALGPTGLTAWFGITAVAQPQVGETVVVSTAAGAVGSVAGQLAKLMGCRTVGIAGGREKVRICRDEYGYDEAVDYRSPTFEQDLAEACGNGVDVYFDNTSGPISDVVMRHLNLHARIAICGTAAIQSWDPWPVGPLISRTLLTRRASMHGFLVTDFEDRFDDALARLAPLVRTNHVRYREDVLVGLDAAPDAIAGLYRGENLGKRIIRLVQPTESSAR
jgi:NADPH-dependent curcumin reductase